MSSFYAGIRGWEHATNYSFQRQRKNWVAWRMQRVRRQVWAYGPLSPSLSASAWAGRVQMPCMVTDAGAKGYMRHIWSSPGSRTSPVSTHQGRFRQHNYFHICLPRFLASFQTLKKDPFSLHFNQLCSITPDP